MEAITIEGKLRSDLGKKANKALRRQELIPCELYGGEENVHFTTTNKSLKNIVYTPYFYKADLQIDGKNYEAIIKDIQWHPLTEAILHVDFIELVKGRAVQTEVPVKIIGTPEGVKTGGSLMLKVRKLKVKSLPELLKDKVEVDVSPLLLGQSFMVRDIADTGMEILTAGSIPVASVEIPRALRSMQALEDEEAAEAAAAAAEAEGEEGAVAGDGAEDAAPAEGGGEEADAE